MAAFGHPVNTIYRFDRADVTVSLDADFLCSGMPGGLRYARDYSARRRAAAVDPNTPAPRLYIAEGSPSITGGMADHRFRMRTSEVEGFAAALASELKVAVGGAGASSDVVGAVAKDLDAHRGTSLVIAGEYQTPRVHAIAHALNQALGNAIGE
jgi:molybdopterin-containing oxidoreductase family iron-sulfur binding subunit